jgi:acetyl esterase/lipase
MVTVYPPIDRELAENVFAVMLEQKHVVAGMSPTEFQEMVKSAHGLWTADLSRGGTVQVRETTIPSAGDVEPLPVLVLSPGQLSDPVPCIYHVANGGKMQQGARVNLTDVEARWVDDLGVALVSVSPRVGPQHRHPAQVEDAYVGLRWVVDHAEELNIDPARILLYGKSGGGGIAAATALYARDQGGPSIANQLLIYPMIDDRLDNPSSNYDIPPWTSANNQVAWSAILGGTAGGPDVSPYAAAARATDLSGLPPAYLEVGAAEVFRDETVDYAARLAKAGIPTEVHSWAGGFHAFEIFAPNARMSRACIDTRTNYLERALDALQT